MIVAEERKEATEEKEEEEEEPQRMFTTKGLAEGLSQLNILLANFEGMDPNIKRFSRIERMVLDASRPYREIYKERKNTNYSDNTQHVYEKNISVYQYPQRLPRRSPANHQQTIFLLVKY